MFVPASNDGIISLPANESERKGVTNGNAVINEDSRRLCAIACEQSGARDSTHASGKNVHSIHVCHGDCLQLRDDVMGDSAGGEEEEEEDELIIIASPAPRYRHLSSFPFVFMKTSLPGYHTPDEIFGVQKTYIGITAISYFVLVWDWLSHLNMEYKLLLRGASSTRTAIHSIFFFARYMTLAWCTFVVVTWMTIPTSPHICAWSRYYPYAYSIISLSAHFIMVMRIHTIYGRRRTILYFMLSLAIVDFAIQVSANHFVTSVLLQTGNPRMAICFIMPTSYAYALVFISPTLLHHIILGMTLYKSIKHVRMTKAAGITSVMTVIQRDHSLYTLVICLVNFANLVLVLQGASWPYRLVNQLPAAAFTQIFLSRIVFSLHNTSLRTGTARTPSYLHPVSPQSRFTHTIPRFAVADFLNDGSRADSSFWDSDTRSRKPSGQSDTSGLAGSVTVSQTTRNFPFWKGKREAFFSPSPSLPIQTEILQLSSYTVPSANTHVGSSPYWNVPFASPLHTDARPALSEYLPYSTGASHERQRTPEYNVELPGALGLALLDIEEEAEDCRISSVHHPSIVDNTASYSHPHMGNSADTLPAEIRSIRSTMTVDDDVRSSSWEAPPLWQTSPSSPRASSIPFSERRLSSSLAQSAVTAPALPTGTEAAITSITMSQVRPSVYYVYGNVFSFMGGEEENKEEQKEAI
ncbi:MAG: hypothetical protein CYPHOPRED_000600 [Cyphobasidiales sp. Tagirdzhanova-0007]|nr:MAG: hypothetical protein CYPHOPRED_000600 [Cyphobasidiales sp. Tagirdzhanova-0007]